MSNKPKKGKPLMSIVIPVYGNWNFTKACLKDLTHLGENHEIIIVDNGNSDPLYYEYFEQPDWMSNNLKIIKNDSNLGFAKAVNKGFDAAAGLYVLFLNNDIRVKSHKSTWTDILIDAASDGSLVSANGGLLDKGLNFVRETDEFVDSEYFYLSGWALCGKRSVLKDFILDDNEFKGPFTEEFITYFEDTDLGFRANDKGVEMKVVDIPVHHFGKMTSKKLNVSELYSSARLKFINKWGGR
jgi:GT2 family glycosyltransferase